MLRFESADHKYFWNNKEVPGVSEILHAIGVTRNYDKVDPFYRDRGTYVHQAIMFHVKQTLDEESLDQENVLPYVRGYQKYEVDTGYMASQTEVPLYSEKHGFAGTIDQMGSFRSGEFDGEGITDLKATESSDKAADLQLCLYAILYNEKYKRWPSFRMVLELHGNQTVTPIFYKTNPEELCRAIMTLYRWKKTRREKQ